MTLSVPRHLAALAALAVLLSPTPAAAASAAPTATPAAAAGTTTSAPTGARHPGYRFAMTANGIGPYRVGASLEGLAGRGQVTNVVEEEICPGFYSAQPTGWYSGRLVLQFQGDLLVWASTTDPALRAAGGGRVGMTLTDIQTRYGSRGTVEIGRWGLLQAFVVPDGDRVLAFFKDPYGPEIYRIAGGERERVLAAFYGSDDSC